jgi:hypothetical protein
MDFKTLVAAVIGAIVSIPFTLLVGVFVPQPREFFLGLPSRVRKQSLRAVERDKAWFIKMKGNPYELLLFVSLEAVGTVSVAITGFLVAFLISSLLVIHNNGRPENNLFIILLAACFCACFVILLWLLGPFQKLRQLSDYENTIAMHDRWIKKYRARDIRS